MTELLPIFPLRHCLFPGVSLRLQIFEQRYLTLVRDSIKDNRPFAVVAIRRGEEVGMTPEIHSWGTLVQIRDWSQLDNGLLGIVVAGDRRIRVRQITVRADGLMQGSLQVYPPDPKLPLAEEDRDLQRLLQDLAASIGVEGVDDVTDLAAVCWQLASLLPLSSDRKQRLLSTDMPEQRRDRLRGWLQALRAT